MTGLAAVGAVQSPGVAAVLIVPEPQSAAWTSGAVAVGGNSSVRCQPSTLAREVGVGQWRAWLKDANAISKPGRIVLKLSTERIANGFKWQRPEGYRLSIRDGKVVVEGFDRSGLHYGIQTLLQIARQSKDGRLPGVVIEDWPDLPIRAMHICLFRYDERTPNYAYLKALLTKVADRAKLNTAVIQIDWMLEYKTHPEVSRKHALTQKQMKELIFAAKQHKVTVIPQIQLLSHQWSFLGGPHPELMAAKGSETYDPTSPELQRIVSDLVKETLGVFDGKFIHVGLDEVGKELEAVATSHNTTAGELFLQHTLWLRGLAKQQGARMLMWPDRFKEYDPSLKLLDRVPRDVIMCEWQYGKTPDFPSLDPFIERGYEVWASGSTKYNPENAWMLARAAHKRNVRGLMATTWNSMGTLAHQQEGKSMSGFITFGEYGWTADKPDYAKLSYDPIAMIRQLCPESTWVAK